MNPKQIVLDKIRNQDISKLHFMEVDYFDNIDENQDNLKYDISRLKSISSIKDRVLKIIEMAEEFATFDESNKFQCTQGANRSTVDIWRLYNKYFRPVSIFSIMRTLYSLVIEEKDLDTLFCNDIKKQVFITGSSDEYESTFIVNELGVRFAEWRNIGL